MAKIGKIIKGIGLGTLGVVNVVNGIVISSVAGPYERLMGDSSPKNEAKELSRFFFEEAKNSFIEAFDE